MPREQRRIIFTLAELHHAMRILSAKTNKPLPDGTCEAVNFDPSKEPALSMTFRSLSQGPVNIAFQKAEVGAALILYCREQQIPLPKSASKGIERDGAALALVVHHDWAPKVG